MMMFLTAVACLEVILSRLALPCDKVIQVMTSLAASHKPIAALGITFFSVGIKMMMFLTAVACLEVILSRLAYLAIKLFRF